MCKFITMCYSDDILLCGILQSLTVSRLGQLLELESEYGPLPGYTPALDEALGYLQEVYIMLVLVLVSDIMLHSMDLPVYILTWACGMFRSFLTLIKCQLASNIS